ncbi:MAG TPA: enterotoxin [Acidobacteriaceae bacterium]|jgi:hypothetical protein|nr:enterotoxin [Acidobacteriaceae bacterium]
MATLLGVGVLMGAWTISAQEPGRATASLHSGQGSVGNHVVRMSWKIVDGRLNDVSFVDELHGTTVPLPTPFAVLLKDGTIYKPDSLRVDGRPQEQMLTAQADASRFAERLAGERVDVALVSADGSAHFTWSVVLRDGSRYIRQILTISAKGSDLPISRVEMLDVRLADAHVVGEVRGSPIVAGNLFLGFEHPLSNSAVTEGRATAWMGRELPLKAGQSISYSAVIGVTRAGQMRRDFLAYIERERAHPYRTFLHYNSWYDLGYFTPYDQAGALDRIKAFGTELHEKRGVTLDSFLFDDGWDKHDSLWRFNSGFPDGFAPIRAAAERYGADPGVWMSPWGGYGKPKQERIAYGRAAGFEIVDNGFALSGPKYYDRFRDVCLEMIRKYGVNQFKFDGTGNANTVFPGSAFDSDFDAAIHLIGEVRAAKPDIYINLTTGTRPSPFWLLYADSIWRGGEDDSTAGVGTYRERWITYRDAETYEGIVREGPLYPLNSLMLHGMIYARFHKQLDKDPGNDFRNEIRSYFGTGTQLQEMYITPSLLTSANWDDLAEAAKWSRANADVLKDTHWVGGDPAWLEVYGWASWAPREGILVLRNPSDKAQTIALDLARVFELPAGAPRSYSARSPWKDDAGKPVLPLRAGQPHTFALAPFEVLTLDMKPQQRSQP